MPLPAIIDTAREHLFSDVADMTLHRLPAATQTHILRLRDLYNYWLQHPKAADKEIVLKLQNDYCLAKSQAYTDLSILKTLLGELQKTTKDYHRFRFNQMIQEAYELARVQKDAKAMQAAAAQYAKYNQLDKEDALNFDYEKIIVQTFVPTEDPSVAGFKPIPNIREKIRSKIDYYSQDSEFIEEIEIEEADYNPDEIFKVNNGSDTK